MEIHNLNGKIMLTFRSLIFSSKHPSPIPPRPLLRRFHRPSNSLSSSKYSTSSKYNRKGPEAHRVISVIEHASRSWPTYIVAASVMGFVGFGTAVVHYNHERTAVLKGLGLASGRLVKVPDFGAPFSLVDTEKVNFIEDIHFTEQDLIGGNWTRLYFVYTASSPDVKPEQVQILSKAIQILVSRHNLKVLPTFVSFDPRVANPSHLGAYLKELDPRIRGLSGPVDAVKRMAQMYRVYFKKIKEEGANNYHINSSHKIYMLSPNLEIMMCFGIEYNAEELSQAILNVVQKTPH